MAHMEPMDVDAISNEFDDKENSLQSSNVLPKTPSTERGYEELDVSELNMKLRYSMTPASSPMSRSFTANCRDKFCENENSNIVMNDNANLTRSFNSTLTKMNNSLKSPKLPLQALSNEQFLDGNGNPINRSLGLECNDLTITLSGTDNEDYLSLPSNSSSLVNTPEATTPTKEIPKNGGSPILRGLKSVLNMFRSSQSPIPHEDTANNLSPPQKKQESSKNTTNLDSTLTAINKNKENFPKTNSPLKESVVFHEDLEKELLWKDETTIIFKEEKIPIHKLLFQPNSAVLERMNLKPTVNENMDITVEYMDVSHNDSVIENKFEYLQNQDKSERQISPESECEFLDCETYTKNDTKVIEDNAQRIPEIKELSQIQLTEDSAFQANIIVPENNLSTAVCDLHQETCAPLPNIDNVMNGVEADLNDDQNKQTDLSIVANVLDYTMEENINDIIQDNVSENPENIRHGNETFDIGKNLEKRVSCIDTAHEHDTSINMSYINKNASLCEEDKSLDKIETLNITNDSNVLTNNINFTIDNFTNQFESDMDILKDNSIIPPLESQEVNKDANVKQEELLQIPVEQCEGAAVMENKFDIKSVPETNDPLEYEEISGIKINDLPAQVPLPYDSDTDKDYLDDQCSVDVQKIDLEKNVNNISVSFSPELQSLVETCNQENNISMGISVENTILPENIINIQDNTCISQSSVDVPEEPANMTIHMKSPNLSFTINETVLCEDSEYIHETYLNKDEEVSLKNVEDSFEPPAVDINNSLQLNLPLKVEICENDIESEALNSAEGISTNTDIINKVTIEINGTIDEQINERSTATNMSVTELDTSIHELGEKENPFETIDKLMASSEIKASELEIRATMEQSFAEILPETNNIDIFNEVDAVVKNEIGIPLTVIDRSITEMEVDVSKHYLEITENPFETENKFINSSEVLSETSAEETHVESNDLLGITAGNNTFVTEIGELKPNIDDANVMEAENLDEEPIKVKHSNTDTTDLMREDSIESAYTNDKICETINTNISDVIVPLEDANNLLVEGNEMETKNSTVDFETEASGRLSPPISSKYTNRGYSINFDEIDDPFSTKTNIRMSPTTDITEENSLNNKPTQNKPKLHKKVQPNRRKSYQERKNSDIAKRAVANVSIGKSKDSLNQFQENSRLEDENVEDNKIDDMFKEKENIAEEQKENFANVDEEVEAINKVPQPITAIYSRNVFNLPEIDDINFNPFATKSKICDSPTKDSEDVLTVGPSENDVTISLNNLSNKVQETIVNNDKTFEIEENIIQDAINDMSSNSSYNTIDVTVREIHTEDEDTEEGPFLEAEDFGDFVKITDMVTEKDMMNFDDLPIQSNNDNVENGEMFIDAEAFEFLLNQNKSIMVADSGKESLFLKFDPLFAKRVSSDGVVAALSRIKNRQSTPKKPTLLKPKNHEHFSSEYSTAPIRATPVAADLAEEPVAASSKPMMVVNPAVASIVSPGKSTPPRANRRSLNFTSPAMAVIDRLLSLSGNTSRLEETSSVPPSREYNETDFALTQLRELLAEKEIHVHSLRLESKELKDRLENMESQVRSLECISEQRVRKVNELNERLAEKNTINKSLSAVVEEYERTIASLIAGLEQDKKRNAEERQKIISERDEQTAHLASMEVSFRDLHSKYEKSKQIILNMKANEDTCKESLKTFEDNLLKMQNNYELLKQHATSKLNHANQELEKFNRSHESEVLKLNAMIKRKDLHITSLEESLSQKTKANDELTAICDELINKVG